MLSRSYNGCRSLILGGYLAAPEDLETWQATADEGVEESEGKRDSEAHTLTFWYML